MEWKALLIIVKEVDATLDGKSYRDTLTPAEMKDAENGAKLFTTVISSITGGNATLTFPDKPVTLTKLTKVSYANNDPGQGVWPNSTEVYDALKAQGAKWEWGQYDSVFVVHPAPGGGWGRFGASVDRGATYATINGKTGWLLTCNGEVFLHEWLHGSCNFFRNLKYKMPGGDADGAGSMGYTKDSGGCWKPYYVDLMTGKVVDKNHSNAPMGGVPVDAWKLGTPKNGALLAGFSLTDKAQNVPEFKKAYTRFPGVIVSDTHRWGSGYIQDFESKDGSFAIMQADGQKGVYVVKPTEWKKFKLLNGIDKLGYPRNDMHAWGNGEVQDFETTAAVHSGMMRATGKTDLFVVSGNIWNRYVKGGGAPKLGHPTNDLHAWGAGEIQDFRTTSGVHTGLMRASGKTEVFMVTGTIWNKFVAGGGAPALGYPTNDLHAWGKGNIQDFEGANGHAGIMQATGQSSAFIVKGNCWKAYLQFGGATGVLGYPTGDEFKWYSDKYKMDLHIQYFQNKRWVWVMSKSPFKMGTDKEY